MYTYRLGPRRVVIINTRLFICYIYFVVLEMVKIVLGFTRIYTWWKRERSFGWPVLVSGMRLGCVIRGASLRLEYIYIYAQRVYPKQPTTHTFNNTNYILKNFLPDRNQRDEFANIFFVKFFIFFFYTAPWYFLFKYLLDCRVKFLFLMTLHLFIYLFSIYF